MILSGLLRGRFFCLILGLAACTVEVERPDFAELTWTHLPPMTLNVAEVEIINSTQPAGSPHVEQLFPLPPARAAERWARDRLKAGGLSNRARFVLQNASVMEVGLERTTGIAGIFKKDQAERYDAELAATLEIRDDAGRLLGQVSSAVRKSLTVPEDASLNRREQAWFEMTDDLLKLFNAEMERNIPAYLGRWLQAR